MLDDQPENHPPVSHSLRRRLSSCPVRRRRNRDITVDRKWRNHNATALFRFFVGRLRSTYRPLPWSGYFRRKLLDVVDCRSSCRLIGAAHVDRKWRSDDVIKSSRELFGDRGAHIFVATYVNTVDHSLVRLFASTEQQRHAKWLGAITFLRRRKTRTTIATQRSSSLD